MFKMERLNKNGIIKKWRTVQSKGEIKWIENINKKLIVVYFCVEIKIKWKKWKKVNLEKKNCNSDQLQEKKKKLNVK